MQFGWFGVKREEERKRRGRGEREKSREVQRRAARISGNARINKGRQFSNKGADTNSFAFARISQDLLRLLCNTQRNTDAVESRREGIRREGEVEK